MDTHVADTFAGLRGPLLKRLVDVRGAIDMAQVEMTEERAKEYYGNLLTKLERYLASGDEDWYREYVQRWMAIRSSEGVRPEGLIHSFVALCDVVVQVARLELPTGREGTQFASAIVQLSLKTSKYIVDSLVEEYDSITDRHSTLRAGETV